METNNIKYYLGNYESEVENVLNEYERDNVTKRIYDKDFTLWSDKPEEVTNRLDWLISPEETLIKLEEINSFVNDVKENGFTHVLLLGMGGSSLAPEVFRFSFGVKEGYLDLSVLDSTDPGAVLEYANKLDPAKTLYIVSSKSGGTLETLSFFKYFFTLCKNKLGENAGKHFVAITDPGSKLGEMAQELNFRKIFVNNPNIGGRYSVLSFFGTVPAGLIGVDLQRLLINASSIADESKNKISSSVKLGVAMAVLAKQGRDKLTFVYSKQINSFGTWVEQLIAESTGKDGLGILPVENESLEAPEFYKEDRAFVYTHFENESLTKIEELKKAGHPVIEIVLKDEYELGAEFFRWEFATAVSSWKLNIQPFDQPNVESAKIESKSMISSYLESGKLPELKCTIEENDIKLFGDTNEESINKTINSFFSLLQNPAKFDYVSIQAYVTPTQKVTELLQILRTNIQRKYKSAVTVGYGPRFLHSTGQLHKGDAGKGLFLQFSSFMPNDADIPKEPGSNESEFTFGVLKTAQLLGDRQALVNNNRKVLTIDLGKNVTDNLNDISGMV